MYKYCFITCLLFFVTRASLFAQQKDTLYSFTLFKDVKITVDRTVQSFTSKKPALLILYALPNGNTTTQTMGKKMAAGDDWHFDIQHIRAQTAFLRTVLHHKNIVVAYLENDYKSWPAWKQKHPDFAVEIKNIVDTLSSLFTKPVIYLNGHSGGGSFIFGYLKGVAVIPSEVHRISFIDSNYGYDSTYNNQLITWLNNKHHSLNVFTYNDSVALYNDKPIVSATGGTWYKSHLMLKHLSEKFRIKTETNDSLIIVKSNSERLQFFFKLNPDRKIFHTQQVELNGFIHSVLCGTKLDSKNYQYYGQRAYTSFIKD